MQASKKLRNSDAQAHPASQWVRHFDSLDWQTKDTHRWARVFGAEEGAQMLTLFAAVLDNGETHDLDAGESEVVLYVPSGQGRISIGGRDFRIKAGDGAHVRSGESFSLQQSGGQALKLLMAVCPATNAIPWVSRNSTNGEARTFDQAYPERVVSSKSVSSEETGDRSFKVLVGPRTGSSQVTQFVGSIPRSRAPEHYHHYEEVICVLSGEGRIWIGDKQTAVRPGSLIFLPREQSHCMECTVESGLDLLGMFYPAGSPAVNYKTGDT